MLLHDCQMCSNTMYWCVVRTPLAWSFDALGTPLAPAWMCKVFQAESQPENSWNSHRFKCVKCCDSLTVLGFWHCFYLLAATASIQYCCWWVYIRVSWKHVSEVPCVFKGISQLFFSFCCFPSTWVPDKKIDPILSTVCAVTRKGWAELIHH